VLAIGLPVLLAAVVAAIALLPSGGHSGPSGQDAPLALPAVPAPAAGSDGCRALIERLPDALVSAGTRLDRRVLAAPEPAGAAAWGPDQNTVTLRCGLERPAELTRTATLLDISGVRWLRLTGDGASSWVAVDRPVYVALTYGDAAGTGPLQDVSSAIMAALPAQRVQPGG
jgi:Protein of unknown function (DUF3515)